MAKIKWKIKRRGPDTWVGTIVLPRGAGGMARGLSVIGPVAATKADAISQAAAIANQIASNPLLQAAFPPGTGVAVKAIGRLAAAAAKGKAGRLLKKLTGKGAKRLVKALKFW